MIRPECGTVQGLLAHQHAREYPCGWCVHAESVARLTAEKHAPLPMAPSRALLLPVTGDQAQANLALLERELDAFEKAHRNGSRRRWLRSVA